MIGVSQNIMLDQSGEQGQYNNQNLLDKVSYTKRMLKQFIDIEDKNPVNNNNNIPFDNVKYDELN